MTRTEAEREIERLTREILRCDQLYYVEATPDVPDHEYDFMMKRLEAGSYTQITMPPRLRV